LIEPGKPWHNGVVESSTFNGKFRDECLSPEWVRTGCAVIAELARKRKHGFELEPGHTRPSARPKTMEGARSNINKRS
jgi:putative transposase